MNEIESLKTQLKESEQVQQALMEALQVGVFRTNAEGDCIFVNNRWLKITGLTQDAVLEKEWFNTIHPDDRDMVYAEWKRSLQENRPFRLEYRFQCPDGQETWVLGQMVAILNQNGQPTGYVGTILDINENKQVQAQLQESQRRFEFAVQGSNDGLWDWFDVNQDREWWSPRFYELLGYEQEELEPTLTNFGQLLHPDDRERTFAEVEAHLQMQKPFDIEYRLKTKSNGYRWFRARGMSLRDETGKPLRMAGSLQDVHDRKVAEAEKERLQQETIAAQQQAIQELSVPIIPIMDRILVMPLVGSIDSRRANHIMRALLAGISKHRAKIIILDITGVSIIDTEIAAYLDKTIQAARLKGARTIVTGISDAVAETIVDLGIDWRNIETLRDLQTGLLLALDSLDLKLEMKNNDRQ